MDTKKKVSFDVDKQIIDILKSVSSALKIKQADILRFSIYRFLDDFLKKITVFEIKNNDIYQKTINIFDIKNIENVEVPTFLQKSGFKSKGKITLIDDSQIHFFCLMKIDNESILKIKENLEIFGNLEKDELFDKEKSFKEKRR